MTIDEWNQRYRTRDALDAEPARLLLEAARELPPGRALDLACGAGRNALWLARAGWDVVAIDGAEEAIRLVREQEPPVDARVADLENGEPLPFADRSFDLVLILYYLHRPLFAEARRVLREGGTIVVAVRTKGRFAIEPGEMMEHLAGLKVLHHQEGEIEELIARI